MENSSAARERLWEDQHLAATARRDSDRRAWLKNFAIVLALIALTLTVAKALANWGAAAGTIRL